MNQTQRCYEGQTPDYKIVQLPLKQEPKKTTWERIRPWVMTIGFVLIIGIIGGLIGQ